MPDTPDTILPTQTEYSNLEDSFSKSNLPGPAKNDCFRLIYDSTKNGKIHPTVAAILLICMNTGQVAVLLGLAFSGVAICLISTMPQNSSCPIAPTDTYGPLVWKLGSLFVSMGVACFFWVMMNRFIHPKSVLLGKENPLSNNTNNTAPNNPSPQIPAIPFTATGVIALFLLIFFLIGFNVKIG